MSEFNEGIIKVIEKLAGTSIGRTLVYTTGHVLIAMLCNRLITGAEWYLSFADAVIEPGVNGIWYYFLDKTWSKYGK